jgi:hypothetical protein
MTHTKSTKISRLLPMFDDRKVAPGLLFGAPIEAHPPGSDLDQAVKHSCALE